MPGSGYTHAILSNSLISRDSRSTRSASAPSQGQSCRHCSDCRKGQVGGNSDGADNAARFIQLCDAFDIPIVFLCDTPGMMAGPEMEETAQVRHVARMFTAAARSTVPFFTIVLRKAYGLGALAMTAGSSQASFIIVAWPSAEFGPMGLEGTVKLAHRKELAAIEDAALRSYQENKALSVQRSWR